MALTKVGINTLKDTAKTVLSESFAEPSAISGSIVGGVSGSVTSTGSFGSIYVDKNVNASAFVGDGSAISGLISAADISGSLGTNAALIRSLTATTITGSSAAKATPGFSIAMSVAL